jgi:ferritin-like protein
MQPRRLPVDPVTRRRFIGASGLAIAGGSAAFLAACGTGRVSPSNDAADAKTVNAVRALSLSAAAAYAQTAPLLQGPARTATAPFRAQVQEHANSLASAISQLGGRAAKPKSSEQYSRELGVSSLKDQAGALRLLVGLENKAIAAYEGALPRLHNNDLRGTFAQIVTNHAQHVSVLVGLLSGNDPSREAPAALVSGKA